MSIYTKNPYQINDTGLSGVGGYRVNIYNIEVESIQVAKTASPYYSL